MMELVAANWWLFVIALIIGIAVAWWIFVANRKTRVVTTRRPDVLDEGAAPAQRNQALIDAPAANAAAKAEPAPTPAPAATASAAGDDLKRIKGVGPKLEKLLHSLGVTTYAEIAGWNDADIDRIDAQLGTFAGRIRRDNWPEQAKLLAAGDDGGFKAKFGAV
ncbi:hypothetical protein SZ64_08815 [Erythrobacter sp. SG61-1L]|uniref:hypothetical protein n=1 Tax=Erythrobacter sp. SG61-1L TaxID=1603897 RepID=UPI0006C8FFCC|nr:hypothetical protein [Erythrobacter sp. SG61-1L]KPL68215.1 hypothetical protein SZ64_08815 [Erythrobacter sp. SG61-1L]